MLPHYDVIIYNKLDSQILWVENNPSVATEQASRAIPAEYVLGVIEVKSTFGPSTALEALEHLQDLLPFMEPDSAGERYPQCLPESFFCYTLYGRLPQENEHSGTALDRCLALSDSELRGFVGAVILRGEGLESGTVGSTWTVTSAEKISDHGNVGGDAGRNEASLLSGQAFTRTVKTSDGKFETCFLKWSPLFFANFANDILARLRGTYRPGSWSSFHGTIPIRSSGEESQPA